MGFFTVRGWDIVELDWNDPALTFTDAAEIFELWFHGVAGAGVRGIVGSVEYIRNL